LPVASETLSVEESAREVSVAIERTDGSDGPVQVDYELVPGSAEAGADYMAASGTLSWADGETGLRSIPIVILEDEVSEDTENFSVRFFNASPAGADQLVSAEVEVSIVDTTEERPADILVEPLSELGSIALRVVNGNGQGGLPGDTLQPLIIRAVDTAADDAPVANIPVNWRVNPEGSAELINADRMITDDNGNASMSVRILSRGFLNVIASVDVAQPANALATRIDPPAVESGPGDAVFTVRAGIAAAEGLSPNQSAVGASLDEACEVLGVSIDQGEPITDEQQDLFATCQIIEARLNDQASVSASLDRLIPKAAFFISDSIIDTTDIQVTNVYSRINALRSGLADQLDVSSLNLQVYDELIPGTVVNAAQNALSGGGAAADEERLVSRLGVFANGAISYGEVDGDENQVDADLRTNGITIGADYRFTDNVVFGAGLGFVSNETDFSPDEGSADVTGLSVSVFGTWYEPGQGYMDAVIDIGRNSYDIRRRINLPDLPDQFGIGSTDANVVAMTVGFGRDFNISGWEFGPYGRMSIISADVDGYSERAVGASEGFGSVLDIRGHAVRSSTFSVGGQLSRNINTRRGVFVPQFRIEAEFENEGRKEGIEATFQHDPSQTPFTVNGNERDSRFINIGIGGSALLTNGKSAYAFYETQAHHEFVTQHWLKLGLRFEFQ